MSDREQGEKRSGPAPGDTALAPRRLEDLPRLDDDDDRDVHGEATVVGSFAPRALVKLHDDDHHDVHSEATVVGSFTPPASDPDLVKPPADDPIEGASADEPRVDEPIPPNPAPEAPAPKKPTSAIATTQTSAVSPLQTPEGRAEAKRRMAHTVIGLAPPASTEITAPRRTSAPPASSGAAEPSKPPPLLPSRSSLTHRPGATTLIGTAPPGIPPASAPPGTAPSAAPGAAPAPLPVPRPTGAPSPIVPRRRTPAEGTPALAATPSVPPAVRIPQGSLLGSSSPHAMPKAGSLICEILAKNGAVTREMVDKALALQEERGGQIGRILVSLGACTEEAIARALIEQLRIRKHEGFVSDISLAARERKDVVGLKVLTRPGRTVATLLLTDLFSFVLAALLATSVHWFRTYSELQTIDWTAWLVVGPSIALCMLTFLGLELYSPMAKSTPDEIRDITFSVSLVHFGASILSTLGDLPIVKWGIFVRSVWWVATLLLVPTVRALVRSVLSVQPWWGIPVCVLGAAKTGRLIVRALKAQPRSGLKPVMLLDDDISKFGTLRASFSNEVMDVYSVNIASTHLLTESQRAELTSDIFGDAPESTDAKRGASRGELDRATQPISSDHLPVAPEAWQTKVEIAGPNGSAPKASESDATAEFFGIDSQNTSRSTITKDAALFPRGKFAEVDGVPLVGDLSLAPILAARLKIPYAVLAMPGVSSAKLLQIVERIGGKFTHLLIIPDLFGFATMGVPAKSLGGILGVEVRQQLLLPGPRLAKRIMDLALTAFGGLFVLPFLLVIAALIKLDSKGPVFYTQKRLGRDGTYFSAFKFRTMHGDGEARLKAILDADPALRAEYDVYHKLKKDPRVTRIGRFLRKFSLDEFPQLLNVLRGDMSLVGPRPYIERELTEMNGQERIILRAPPGMTGMWQVSDRNATSFAQRVQIDVYYVRNWSPWLDIHILAKTFGVVVKGSGV